MVVEEKKERRLQDFGINIKTKFKDGEERKERNTDHSKDDNIKNGIILEKDYYKNGALLRKETLFDSRITYCYVFDNQIDITCKNCGMRGRYEDFTHGCPYCDTPYNMEYEQKELGSKHYFDLTIKKRSYVIITYIIDFIVSFIITLMYILDTSRTFYFFDIVKVLIGTILISLLLFYVFYYLDAIIILPGLKKWKMMENEKQKKFWESLNYTDAEKTKFFNNINYSLRQYYYGDQEKDVVDFDIIDYNNFKKDTVENHLVVDVSIELRIVRFIGGKIKSKRVVKKYRFKKVEQHQELQGGANAIECPNCGSSMNVMNEECTYCGTPMNHYQEWYLIKELD